jgi:uncharacterized phage protein (TIGR01671 family)
MEIKFRGLRKDGKGWAYGYYFIDLENKLPYIMLSERKQDKEEWMVKSLEVIPETVGQYVGSTDENGKEIYSGDKIRFKYLDKQEEEEFAYCESTVEFEKGAFRCREFGYDYESKKQVPMTLFEFIEDEEIEIIGNIHEKYGN